MTWCLSAIFYYTFDSFNSISKSNFFTFPYSPAIIIYSETDNNDKNPGKAYYKGNDLILYKPEIYPLCYYNNSPCTHDINVQFTIDEIRFKKKYGYKIYFFGQ